MLAFLVAVAQASSRVETFAIDGVTRQVLVFPGSGPAPHPLVLAFHGHGGGMRQAARSFGVQSLWPEATVIYPQGLPTKGMTDPEGNKPGWQQNVGDAGDRDLKLVDMILGSEKGYDSRLVYAMGHSNGGRFTYLLWTARGERFAAYGPSSSPAALLVRSMRPASAFVTAGETDPIVPFAVQKATIDRLARLDGVDLGAGAKAGFVTLAQGANGLELGTYVSPAGHAFPPDAVSATVALFKRHAR